MHDLYQITRSFGFYLQTPCEQDYSFYQLTNLDKVRDYNYKLEAEIESYLLSQYRADHTRFR